MLCKSCNKCQTCCNKSACRGPTSKLLANLAGPGCRSESSSNPERGLHPPLPDPAKPHKVSHSHKLLCQSSQEQLPVGGITSAYGQKCRRTGPQSEISRVFQPTVLSPPSQQKMETHPRPEQTKPISQNRNIQNGDTGNHQNIPPARGVGHLHRFQGRLLPHTNTGTIQEILKISCPRANIPIQSSAFRSVHSTLGVHCGSKGGETDGHAGGYKAPPIPRRLVSESFLPPGLSPAYSGPGEDVPKTGLAGELGKVRTGAQTSLRFCRLPVRPQVRSGQTYTGTLAKPPGQNIRNASQTDLSGPAVYIPDRFTYCHRKASSPRPSSHAPNTMAPQKQLEGSRIIGKDDSHPQVLAPTSTVVARRRERSHRSALTPFKTRSATLYRRIKRRVGRSLKRGHCKRNLVPPRKQTAYKLPGTQSSLLSLKRVPRPLHRQDSSCSNRQYHCGGVHKQRRRNAIGSPLCSPLENTNLVYQTKGNPQSPTYSRPSKCDSRQAIQAWSDHPDRVVSPSRGLSRDMQEVAPTSNGLVCHKVQQQVAPICVTSTGPPGYSSGRTQSAMGGSGCICLPTNSHSGQSGGEVAKHPMQKDHFDRPGVAEHALVLGSGNHVQSNPSESTLSAKPPITTIQSDPSPKSDKPESPCMASRAEAIKRQGFSKAVAEKIEAPQRVSTRSVYEAKWTIFTKWCISNQVDFRAPPINSVADFLLYLFQDRKLQPSTIDGYRTAIADKLGNSPTNISKDENLTCLLDSFHRDRTKGRRGIPSWNLSLVLHQLTKAPFEPIKEASMKHLTFKTVFLLALGSGKRRSEIHAWLHRNIRHQSDWSKVSLYPSPSFLSKNQLAKEGPESVAPVVIPALAPTLDKSLRSDRSLCPVRALRYYLDRTSDLRQNKELVFVSFKKGFDKDISPATISSWIKQTVILCYELSDHQAHTLHQVKAHDVRAFAASKAFQSGVSWEQILSACHWKSHNTFTQFYLKDVAWADAELYHLGPVVAAQQIHQRTSAKGRSVHI